MHQKLYTLTHIILHKIIYLLTIVLNRAVQTNKNNTKITIYTGTRTQDTVQYLKNSLTMRNRLSMPQVVNVTVSSGTYSTQSVFYRDKKL